MGQGEGQCCPFALWVSHSPLPHPCALCVPEKFTQVLVEQQQDRARREQERIRLFSADPFDLEAQAKIEEEIR